jgi:hypothetical protein
MEKFDNVTLQLNALNEAVEDELNDECGMMKIDGKLVIEY